VRCEKGCGALVWANEMAEHLTDLHVAVGSEDRGGGTRPMADVKSGFFVCVDGDPNADELVR
jgi:hypothetical protein